MPEGFCLPITRRGSWYIPLNVVYKCEVIIYDSVMEHLIILFGFGFFFHRGILVLFSTLNFFFLFYVQIIYLLLKSTVHFRLSLLLDYFLCRLWYLLHCCPSDCDHNCSECYKGATVASCSPLCFLWVEQMHYCIPEK